VEEKKPAGRHLAEWNGKNQSGNKVISGVYFYRLEVGGWVGTRKMVVLR